MKFTDVNHIRLLYLKGEGSIQYSGSLGETFDEHDIVSRCLGLGDSPLVSFGMVLVKILNIYPCRLLKPFDKRWKILMGNVKSVKIRYHVLADGTRIQSQIQIQILKSVKIRHHVLAVGVTNPESSAEAKCDRPKLPLENHQREERTHSSTWIEEG